MAKFNFPQNPNADRENPFNDEQGANPFGDDAAPVIEDGHSAAEENPYGTKELAGAQPYLPGDYETFLPNRGAFVWWLGLIGFCIQLLAIVVAVLAILSVADFLEGIVYGLPFQLIGLAVTIPAWIMGQSDLKSIAAGAMEDDVRDATRWGFRFGTLGTLLGLSQLFLFVGLVVFEEFFA